MPYDGFRGTRTEVVIVSPAGVIGMSMRDQGALYRSPGIDVYIGLLAVDSTVCKFQ